MSKTVEQLLEEQNRLIAEQNELLAQSNAEAHGASFREDMRGVARKWDAENPILKYFAINPYGQWK